MFVSLPETWTNPTNSLLRLNTCQFHKLNAGKYWSIEKQSQREFRRRVWSTRADEPRQKVIFSRKDHKKRFWPGKKGTLGWLATHPAA